MSPNDHVSGGDTAVLEWSEGAAPPDGPLTVVAFSGREPGARALELAGPSAVGRDPSVELSFDDASLSRRHARLTPEGDSLGVVNLGSRNGTFVDGRRVTSTVARAGSLIRAGSTFFRLVSSTEPWEPAAASGPLVGGTQMAPVRRLISLVSATDLPVLLLGETGTGKEVVARLLHAQSQRRGPFIPVNCAALPDSLVESELFGHVSGAFTGARARKGLFAVATGGTLFLDEVGDVPLGSQAKLLRVLDDGVVRAVGAETGRKTDVRILSATNRDLARAVAEGRFRADLLARLSAVELKLPALRDRPEDLPALCAFLLGRAGLAPTPLHADALEAMALYDWPQNVRELDNLLRQATLSGPREITVELLAPRLRERLAQARQVVPMTPPAPRGDVRLQLEDALRAHGGNVRQASRALGVARGHLYRLAKRWDVDLSKFRVRPAAR